MSTSASKGKAETQLLKENINDQLNRLLTQLEDLEELRVEFTDAEYAEEKAETLAQLREFQAYLDQTVSGNMTLMDEFGAAQLAMQAAISQAFKTPEVIRLFASKNVLELRRRLGTIDRDLKTKVISQDMASRMSAEVLTALKKMGEKLSPAEEELLGQMGTTRFLEATAEGAGADIMSTASAGIKRAEAAEEKS